MAITLDGTTGILLPGANTSSQMGSLTLGSKQASTSGTEIIFNDIPSWVKRITVMLDGVSSTTTGGSFLVRLGSGGTIVDTGYWSMSLSVSGATTTTTTITNGIYAGSTGSAATSILYTVMTLVLMDSASYTWFGSAIMSRDDTNDVVHNGSGRISLSGVLNCLSVVPTVGSFDAGSINIMYE